MGRIPAERNTSYSRIHIKLPMNELECAAEHSLVEELLEAEFA
jgi:hypothetical protein